MRAVNKPYGTVFKTGTDSTQMMAKLGLAGLVQDLDTQRIPTECLPLVGELKDDNEGRAVFGEYEAPAKREAMTVAVSAKTAKSKRSSAP